MEQPVPSVTQADVVRIARRDFGDRSDAALELLDSYIGNEQARVRLAVLKLSEGHLDELKRMVEAARLDYRDVLMWAE